MLYVQSQVATDGYRTLLHCLSVHAIRPTVDARFTTISGGQQPTLLIMGSTQTGRYSRPRKARGTVISSSPDCPQLAPVFWSRWAIFCPTLLLLVPVCPMYLGTVIRASPLKQSPPCVTIATHGYALNAVKLLLQALQSSAVPGLHRPGGRLSGDHLLINKPLGQRVTDNCCPCRLQAPQSQIRG